MAADGGGGRVESGLDLMAGRAHIAGIGFERVDRALQHLVDELAKRARIERQGLFVFDQRAPTQGVAPEEGERVAQHQAKRRRGLHLRNGARDDGMVGAHPAVMSW